MLHDWNGEGFLFKTSGQGRTLGWTSSPGEFSSFCPIRFLTMDAVESWVPNHTSFHFLPTGILKFVTWVLGSNLFRRPNELHWLTPGHLEKMWRWNHLNIISFPSEIMSQNDFLSESRELFMHLSFYFFIKKLRPMSPPPDIDEAMKRIHGSTVNHQKCELALKFLSTGLGWRRGAVRDKLLFFQVSLPSHCRITRVLKKYM